MHHLGALGDRDSCTVERLIDLVDERPCAFSGVAAHVRYHVTADVQLIGEWFQLHLIRNPGAAFSTGSDFTPVLSALAVAACVVVVYLARRLGNSWWAVSLGLLLAGIAGNLTDRLFRAPEPLHGHVVDFFALPHWPIFNFADIFIDVGAALALLLTFRGIGLDGSRDHRRSHPDGADDTRGPDDALPSGPPG